HYQATTKAKIIHRDISGGNILILPKAMFDQRKGRKFVKWFGLLADWEMSKPIYEKPSLSRARQPERTGTWQFMSAAALSDHSKIIGTPDELESFFYVLLYNSVRYLKSNCIDAGSFIEQFFDTY
ncbi:uncharacterized protein TRAVEDRAFT_88303, partial [Trametes versicolor FP-101664 SS1]|uniref:uncharacterized protein n=1 Tax=Trametes versicolor (strain FP-101664) TaxID=717944 RepID=UPI00046220A8